VKYALTELLDIPTVQALLDSLDEINRLPSAVLDPEGNILTSTAWQDICTKFHRIDHKIVEKCIESDTRIKIRIGETSAPVIYHCPMGLIDAAIPIIIEGKHLGNVFIGQLFMEQADEAYFIEQARHYGFDECSYLTALRKVPICSEEQLRTNLAFISNLVQLLAEQGLKNKRQLEYERELEESKKKLKVIFDTSEAGIIVVSPLGIITFANRRMSEMFGTFLKELVGTHYIDYVHESEKTIGSECMNQIIHGEKKSVELVRHFMRKDGTDFWGNLTGTRFENIDGSMRDQIIVISDITERKQAEIELVEKNIELERFTYTVSHDLKSPLVTICSFAGIIRQEIKEGNYDLALNDLEFIENAANKMTALLNDLLELSRIGKAMNAPARIDMNQLVKDVMTQVAGLLEHLKIEIFIDQSLPEVTGDYKRIDEVVQNLIENAIKYMGDQPTPRIEIGVRPDSNDTVFFVKDNGIGIDPKHHESIFGLFNKLNPKTQGTGVGLALVKRIIEVHGGRIWVNSEGKDTGSCFFFTLPHAVS
jgi:PAS domain S-box-containing protein